MKRIVAGLASNLIACLVFEMQITRSRHRARLPRQASAGTISRARASKFNLAEVAGAWQLLFSNLHHDVAVAHSQLLGSHRRLPVCDAESR